MDCTHCDKKFSTRSNLVRHIKKAHSDREVRESYAKKRKLDGTLSVSDNESEETQSDATVSENGDSDQDETQSDSDPDEKEMEAWKWFAIQAAKLQNGQTATDILELVNGRSTSKEFMDNLQNVISNHRKIYTHLTKGDIYSKIMDAEDNLKTDHDFHQWEARKCAWRMRKYLVKNYINEIFSDQ